MDEGYSDVLDDDDVENGFTLGVITNANSSTVGHTQCVVVTMRQFAPSIRATKRHFAVGDSFFIVEAFGSFNDLPHSNAGASWHNLSDDIPLAGFAVLFAEDQGRVDAKIREFSLRLSIPDTKLLCAKCSTRFVVGKPFIDANEITECPKCHRKIPAGEYVLREYF